MDALTRWREANLAARRDAARIVRDQLAEAGRRYTKIIDDRKVTANRESN